MKAAVFHGKGDIRVDSDYPTPVPGDSGVLIRVKACGVCGTDVHIFSGAQGATAALDSSVLLQGHKTVAISHNGSVYRLQATKLGKLILTK